MSKIPSASPTFKRVMDATGFFRNGKPTPGVLDAQSLLKNKKLFDKHFKYEPVINPNNLGAAAVYELDGSPCIYFKYLDEQTPFPIELVKIHRIAWNHGLAPMLWVITATEVLIYSCYSKPTRIDEHDPSRHLIESFKNTPADLKRLNDFAGRLQIETGKFWTHDKIKRIDRDQRVDRSLLDDLTAVQERLGKSGLAPVVARGLLGRCILVAWLQDRKIFDKEFFRDRYQVPKFSELLRDKKATYDLFKWLIHDCFHDNIFPLTYTAGKPLVEEDIVKPEHLEIIRRMFENARVKRGVKQPWPYNFDVMPVEYLSSIYEMFLDPGSGKIAPVRSTHYTPLNLVDLVLANVFEKFPKKGNVMDLSCGSGVFLVEALRRLVARKIEAGQKWTRDMIRDTMYNEIWGLDVNPNSIQITAFCLYLTALELDPDRQSIEALNFKPLIGNSLIIADAFDGFAPFNVQEPFRSRNFAAIVGNPPWTRCKDKGLAWDYCRQHKYPLARSDTPDQAFLWRISRFAGDNTVVGLLLHGSPFFSHAKPALKAKRAIMTLFTPKVLLNLSDLRQDVLFPKTSAPAMLYVAQGRRPDDDDTFKFTRPERSNFFKKHGIIEINPDQVRRLPVVQASEDTDMLKIASWGTLQDLALIQKVRSTFPSLERFCNALRCRKGLNRGQGFQRTGGNKDVPELHGLPWLESGKMPRFVVDAKSLPKLPPMKFLSPRNPGIYWGPLVITVRGIPLGGFKAAFVKENCLYTEEYYGLSFAASDESHAHYLNAILNSSLGSYYLFLTGSVWGVERDKVEPNDLMGLPIPSMTPANKTLVTKLLDIEAQILKAPEKSDALCHQLNQAVFDLYGLNEYERTLVTESVNFTLDYKINRDRSPALKAPKPQDIFPYAEKMLLALGQAGHPAPRIQIFDIPGSPLQAVKISLHSDPKAPIQTIPKKDFNALLEDFISELPPKLVEDLYPLNFVRVINGDEIYILKPAQRRHWTFAAALHDAEAILAETKPKK